MTNNCGVIGERLYNVRKSFGYSLSYVAEACGIQQYQTVSKWESGTSTPSLEKLLQLCELYGCDLGYLIGEQDCKTRKNTDINAEIGLSEKAINLLRADNAFKKHRIHALNALIEFDNGEMLQDIYNYLFYRFNKGIEVENFVINGENMADVFLLEIIGRLKTIRQGKTKEG